MSMNMSMSISKAKYYEISLDKEYYNYDRSDVVLDQSLHGVDMASTWERPTVSHHPAHHNEGRPSNKVKEVHFLWPDFGEDAGVSLNEPITGGIKWPFKIKQFVSGYGFSACLTVNAIGNQEETRVICWRGNTHKDVEILFGALKSQEYHHFERLVLLPEVKEPIDMIAAGEDFIAILSKKGLVSVCRNLDFISGRIVFQRPYGQVPDYSIPHTLTPIQVKGLTWCHLEQYRRNLKWVGLRHDGSNFFDDEDYTHLVSPTVRFSCLSAYSNVIVMCNLNVDVDKDSPFQSLCIFVHIDRVYDPLLVPRLQGVQFCKSGITRGSCQSDSKYWVVLTNNGQLLYWTVNKRRGYSDEYAPQLEQLPFSCSAVYRNGTVTMKEGMRVIDFEIDDDNTLWVKAIKKGSSKAYQVIPEEHASL